MWHTNIGLLLNALATPSQPTQTGFSALVTSLREHLHPNTNAQHRNFIIAYPAFHDIGQTAIAKLAHYVIERTNARENEFVGGFNIFAPTRNHRLGLHPPKHIKYGGEITNAVINN